MLFRDDMSHMRAKSVHLKISNEGETRSKLAINKFTNVSVIYWTCIYQEAFWCPAYFSCPVIKIASKVLPNIRYKVGTAS